MPKPQGLTEGERNTIQKIINQIERIKSLREKLIETIQELLSKPPVIVNASDNSEKEKLTRQSQEAQQTIQELEQKLSRVPTSSLPNDMPFGENLAVIKQLELTSLTELFGVAVDLSIRKQIEDAINYSQVVQARQTFLAKHLTPQSTTTITNLSPTTSDNFWPPERTIWISLLALSLLTIGRLAFHLKKSRRKSLLK